jgi:hypothetical protein
MLVPNIPAVCVLKRYIHITDCYLFNYLKVNSI